MRVAAVIHYPEFGGPHNQILRLAGPLAARGVHLTCILPDGPGADRLVEGGVDVRRVSLGRVRAVPDPRLQLAMAGRFPRDLVDLHREFRRTRPDIVQLSSLINPQAAYVAKAMVIPVVWQIVDTRPPMPLRRVMMMQIRVLADVLMPIGVAVADAHPGADSFGDRSIRFFPPVDLEEFTPDGPASLRQELGIDPDAPVVTVIGNINPQKGHEYIVRAAAIVRKSHPDAVFVLVGHLYDNHQDYHDGLLALARSLDLEPGRNLHLPGARRDIAAILRASDVFALASVPNSEGMPTVILEAMACGVPVVATEVGSVREAVIDGETGYVVPSLDVNALAARINDLLANPTRRAAFGAAARRTAESRFSLERYTETHLDAYQRALACHRCGKGET